MSAFRFRSKKKANFPLGRCSRNLTTEMILHVVSFLLAPSLLWGSSPIEPHTLSSSQPKGAQTTREARSVEHGL